MLLRERTLLFGDAKSLVGIITEPAPSDEVHPRPGLPALPVPATDPRPAQLVAAPARTQRNPGQPSRAPGRACAFRPARGGLGRSRAHAGLRLDRAFARRVRAARERARRARG